MFGSEWLRWLIGGENILSTCCRRRLISIRSDPLVPNGILRQKSNAQSFLLATSRAQRRIAGNGSGLNSIPIH
jgi:hypothetical protein